MSDLRNKQNLLISLICFAHEGNHQLIYQVVVLRHTIAAVFDLAMMGEKTNTRWRCLFVTLPNEMLNKPHRATGLKQARFKKQTMIAAQKMKSLPESAA